MANKCASICAQFKLVSLLRYIKLFATLSGNYVMIQLAFFEELGFCDWNFGVMCLEKMRNRYT